MGNSVIDKYPLQWPVGYKRENRPSRFNALQPKQTDVVDPWWKIMGYYSMHDKDFDLSQRFRELAKEVHPDMPKGSTEAFQKLENAYREGMLSFT